MTLFPVSAFKQKRTFEPELSSRAAELITASSYIVIGGAKCRRRRKDSAHGAEVSP